MHSEDVPPEIIGMLYLVEAQITSSDGDEVVEEFTSLCYPGK